MAVRGRLLLIGDPTSGQCGDADSKSSQQDADDEQCECRIPHDQTGYRQPATLCWRGATFDITERHVPGYDGWNRHCQSKKPRHGNAQPASTRAMAMIPQTSEPMAIGSVWFIAAGDWNGGGTLATSIWKVVG